MVTQVTSDVLANSSVTSEKIANGAVTGTTIANNSIDGTKIALGSDAQGDIMFYNGTDWARLAAGTPGQVLQTNGNIANPSWISNTWGGTVSDNANGYVTFPGGVTLQWGTASALTTGTAVVFPIAFTTATYNVQVSPTQSNDIWITSVTISGFTVTTDTATQDIYWQAIGK